MALFTSVLWKCVNSCNQRDILIAYHLLTIKSHSFSPLCTFVQHQLSTLTIPTKLPLTVCISLLPGTRLECDCDIFWIISNDNYMSHLLYPYCTNRTSFDKLDPIAMADFCATNPQRLLLDYGYEDDDHDEYYDDNPYGYYD